MKYDIEDIFKKAADEYPLKTNTADWESVRQKLQFEPDTIRTKTNVAIGKLKVGLVCALLLIPLSLTITKYYGNYKSADTISIAKKDQTSDSKNLLTNGIYSKELKNKTQHLFFSTSNSNGICEQNTIALPALTQFINDRKNQIENIIPNSACINETIKNTVQNSKPLLVINSTKDAKKLLAENASKEKNAARAPVKKLNDITKHFYLGIVGAGELTSVKFQPAKQSVNGGGIIGYSINNKINIELGVVLAKKYYYTNGKYIEPKSIRRDNSKILNANANSSITELPLTVQYNLKRENDSRIFLSAGSVSYVIHKESYRYTYMKNGRERQSSKNFKKASDNLFSNVQVSAGYEHSIFNNAGSFRIEPYCRIPVRGIGASNLPVTSIGINIALTKYIK